MGWGRMLLLGNVGQQLDIQDLKTDLEQQESRDSGQDRQIDQLRRDSQNLKLAVTALSRLLVSKAVLTPEEVQQIGRAIEM